MQNDNGQSGQLRRFPHIQGIAPQTAKLIELLKDGSPGDSQADDSMSALIGRDVRNPRAGGGHGNLSSAIKYVERHHGRVWRRVKCENRITCLSSSEIVGVVDRRRQHIGRTVRRAKSELSRVQFEKLESDEKTRALTLKAQFAILALESAKNPTKRIAANMDSTASGSQQAKMLEKM